MGLFKKIINGIKDVTEDTTRAITNVSFAPITVALKKDPIAGTKYNTKPAAKFTNTVSDSLKFQANSITSPVTVFKKGSLKNPSAFYHQEEFSSNLVGKFSEKSNTGQGAGQIITAAILSAGAVAGGGAAAAGGGSGGAAVAGAGASAGGAGAVASGGAGVAAGGLTLFDKITNTANQAKPIIDSVIGASKSLTGGKGYSPSSQDEFKLSSLGVQSGSSNMLLIGGGLLLLLLMLKKK
jgi:hypothetical protein